jgi:hypothetical protein
MILLVDDQDLNLGFIACEARGRNIRMSKPLLNLINSGLSCGRALSWPPSREVNALPVLCGGAEACFDAIFLDDVAGSMSPAKANSIDARQR